MLFSKQKKSDSTVENPFWISYSDILSSLLIIILLVTVFVIYELMSTRDVIVTAVVEAEQTRKEVLINIKEELEKNNITVEITDSSSVLRIPESTLAFESNRFTVPSDSIMQENLKIIGVVLFNEISKNERFKFFDTIFIEGHTDIRPTQRELGNWGLSTYRAISVWNYWNDVANIEFDVLMNSQNKALFSVSGYGESRPSTEQQITFEDYRKNRRIDIRFTIKTPSSIDLNQIGE